jgi:hypothetical protein
MIILLLISLIIPLAIGYFIISSFWPETELSQNDFLIRSFIGGGLGFGITSCFFFVWLLVVGPSIGGLVTVEIALLISLIYFYKIKRPAVGLNRRSQSKQITTRIFAISFYIIFFSAFASFVMISLKNPHGRWDAWSIWNLHARFLFRGADHWKDMFSGHLFWSHPDYPLLIPATVARCWKFIGRDTLVIPALISMFFTFAMAGLVFAALSIIRDKTQGFLAGMVLLATPFFIEHGASQYADIPLGFFFLSTLVLFSLHQELSGNRHNLLLLAGITTGLAIWTKNEGFLFLVSIIISRIVYVVPAKGVKTYIKQMLPYTIGLLPILAITLYLKTQLAPPNDLFSSQGYQAVLAKLTDLDRYLLVGKTFVERIAHSGGWVTSVTFLLIFYLLLLGIKPPKNQKRTAWATMVTLGLMLTGYFLVYITTHHDLHWYLLHALGRLLLQLYPSFIFAFFLIAGSPKIVEDFAV